MQNNHRLDSLSKRRGMQPAIDVLAAATSKTSTVVVYDKHVTARIDTVPAFKLVMELKTTRRWRFDAYQHDQRAAKKLSTALRGDIPSSANIVVAWGDGSFGPTSRGHAPAPP